MDYIQLLLDMRSYVVATIDFNGNPVTRSVDIVYYDKNGVYFIVAKTSELYKELAEQKHISLYGLKGKVHITLNGCLEMVGNEFVGKIFSKNTHLKDKYPSNLMDIIEVFRAYNAKGMYSELADADNTVNKSFAVAVDKPKPNTLYVNDDCIGCAICYSICPKQCINILNTPVKINSKHCIQCGECEKVCPVSAISLT